MACPQALSQTFGWLLFFRCVQGFFGGVPPVALAFVTDIFTPSERPPFLATVQATVSFSFVGGAVVGGGLAWFSLSAPLFFSAAVSLIGLIVGYFYLLDPKTILSEAETFHIKTRNSEAELQAIAYEDDVSACQCAHACMIL